MPERSTSQSSTYPTESLLDPAAVAALKEFQGQLETVKADDFAVPVSEVTVPAQGIPEAVSQNTDTAESHTLTDNDIFDKLHEAQAEGTADESLIKTVSAVAAKAGYGSLTETGEFVPNASEEGQQIAIELRRTAGEDIPTEEAAANDLMTSESDIAGVSNVSTVSTEPSAVSAPTEAATLLSKGEPAAQPIPASEATVEAGVPQEAGAAAVTLVPESSDAPHEQAAAALAEVYPPAAEASAEAKSDDVVEETLASPPAEHSTEDVIVAPVTEKVDLQVPATVEAQSPEVVIEPTAESTAVEADIEKVPTSQEGAKPEVSESTIDGTQALKYWSERIAENPTAATVEQAKNYMLVNGLAKEKTADDGTVTIISPDGNQGIVDLFNRKAAGEAESAAIDSAGALKYWNEQLATKPSQLTLEQAKNYCLQNGLVKESTADDGTVTYTAENPDLLVFFNMTLETPVAPADRNPLKDPKSPKAKTVEAGKPDIEAAHAAALRSERARNAGKASAAKRAQAKAKPEVSLKPEVNKAGDTEKAAKAALQAEKRAAVKAAKIESDLTATESFAAALRSERARNAGKASAEKRRAERADQQVKLEERLIGLIRPEESSNDTELDRLENKIIDLREGIATLAYKERRRLMGKGYEPALELLRGQYEETVKELLVRRAKDEFAKGEMTEAQVVEQMVLAAVAEKRALSLAEIQQAREGIPAKVRDWYRSHGKIRTGINIALTATGVLATAGGAVPIAVAAIGLKSVIAGAAAYDGTRQISGSRAFMKTASAMHVKSAKTRESIDMSAAAALGKTDLYRRMAALQSSDEINIYASKPLQAERQASEGVVESEIVTRMIEDAEVSLETGGAVIDQVMEDFAEILAADRAQIEADRRGNTKRTLAAVVVGMTTAALGGYLSLEKVQHAKAAKDAVLSGAKPPKAPALHLPSHAKPPVHVYHGDYTVHHGDSIWSISKAALKRNYPTGAKGWNQLSLLQQNEKIDFMKDSLLKVRHGKSLLMPGQKLSVSKSLLQSAINYKQ